MDIKSKRCSWYRIFFCINVALYGLFWSWIGVLKSSMWFSIIGGYGNVELYPKLFTEIIIIVQILMLIFLLCFIKHTDTNKASYTRKVSSEFVITLFALYTIFVYYIYRDNQVFSFGFKEDYFYDIYSFWSAYGETVRELTIAFLENVLIASGYLCIITAVTLKTKGRYWKEDSLLVKLYGHYKYKRISPLRNMYFNDIFFFTLQVGIILYEVIASMMIIDRRIIFIHYGVIILGVIPLTCEAFLIIWKCKVEIKEKDIRSLANEIHKISQGETPIENNIPKNSYLYEAGEEIKNISNNLSGSIQQQIKSEKLKVDLITNISHDLKTPLTSIVGYIDLLSTRDYLSGEDKHYVAELKKKSENLRDMINMVFELSKASSGNLKVDTTRLDLNKLILQTMADMGDLITESEFEIKSILCEADLEFNGDGAKLYLVCQNLISNALKYSLKGSRIFIKTYQEPGYVCFCIQNTSAYEIDFSPEEITGRFVRGDETRSDGGNGLGLAIAKTYTEVCGGEFDLRIDGDLFKVTLRFPTTAG